MMLKDANSKLVIKEVKKRVAEIQKNLPEGIFINPILERSELIAKTSFTIVENLILGCLIVLVIVILLLGNIRSALVIASMIPLALLFTLSMMYVFGIDANLMSLGALDFGIIIDGAVIIVEYIAIRITANKSDFKRLGGAERQTLIDKVTFKGASKMMNSAIFGQVIILIVFIPILSLSGVEGKMFHPMALSFSFAIIGAMILGLTWLPVAASLFLKPAKTDKKNISDYIMEFAYRTYEPVMRWACCHKKAVLGTAIIAMLFTGYVFTKMGGEFVPTLDEGDFVIQPVLKTGTSLSKTVELTTRMENILLDNFTEVDQIVCRIGAAEVPTDPMSMEEIDMIIKLRPRNEWVNAKNKEQLADKFKEALSIISGIEYEFTQPIEMRFNELITGVRADIAIKIFGDDLYYLDQKANEIKTLIEDVPGAADIILEKTAGLPQMSVKYNRNKIAYHGVDIQTLNSYLAMAFGGETTGSVFEGEKRFDLTVRLQKQNRVDIDNIQQLQIPLPNGNQIPLKELADISFTEGPAKISRENTHRRVVVSVNVRNRDLQSVVEDIQSKINKNIKLEPGNYIAYGGQFENLQNASKRLLFAVPLALLLIFIFLHFAFKSFKDAIMIFTAVPLSTVGGVLFLWIRGMPFSVSAGIGFIALFGVAVLNGIVLIEHLKDLKIKDGSNMKDLILQGTKDRLRPVMLTAAAAAMGFLPMAISTGAGAEVQRPLATVVIGGLFTSTLLTMIALPLLFEIFYNVVGIKLWPPKFIRSKSCVAGMLIIFFTLSTQAQTKSIQLDEAINIAIQNNKELNAYALKVKESEAMIPTAFAIDKTMIYYSYDENNVADNGHPLRIWGLEQNFNFPTVYFAQKAANNKNVSIAETILIRETNLLSKNVSQVYFEIQHLLDKQLIYAQIDSLYKDFSKSTELRYEHGDISQLEVLNAKAKLQQINKNMIQLKFNLDIAYQRLQNLMQSDSAFSVPLQNIDIINLKENAISSNSGLQILNLQIDYQKALLRIESNKLLPDLSLNYFWGSNKYTGSKNYHGFQFGLAVPLFFGEQNARIKANKIAINIEEDLREHYKISLQAEYAELKSELQKLQQTFAFYNSTGKKLGEEIIRSSNKSYQAGEIDFYQFVMSIENALSIKLDHLDDIWKYNQIALEINYLNK